MATTEELIEGLRDAGATRVDSTPDRVNSISSAVIRAVMDDQLVVAVGYDQGVHTQITSLLDALALWQAAATSDRPATYKSGIKVVVGTTGPGAQSHPPTSEAVDALWTLVDAFHGGPSVSVVAAYAVGGRLAFEPITQLRVSFENDPRVAHYLELLNGTHGEVSALARDLIKLVNNPRLRAYPMLTNRGQFSLRLDGLEVGRVRSTSGSLKVGGPTPSGVPSKLRAAWLAVAKTDCPIEFRDGESLEVASRLIQRFAMTLPPDAMTQLASGPLEHALESRILRGAVPVVVNGVPLTVIEPNDTQISWGSQFPTLWGRSAPAVRRYLDGIMRDGAKPWALEMKVRRGGGFGRNYRHALAQAVLYRHFIRTAEALDPWFTRRNMDRRTCEAAVVVPRMPLTASRQRSKLLQLAEPFDVPIIEVDPSAVEG